MTETTNTMGLLKEGVQLLSAAVDQIHTWPISVLLAAALVVIGISLRMAEYFPNRLIPPIIFLLGAVLNVGIGDPGKVSPSVPYPWVAQALYGLLIGFLSWVVFRVFLLKRFEKYLPLLFNGNGETEIHPTPQLTRRDIGLDQPPPPPKPPPPKP